MTDFSVFPVQLNNGLLIALKKQLYDFPVIYPRCASFPASLIYYDFVKKNYMGCFIFHNDYTILLVESHGMVCF